MKRFVVLLSLVLIAASGARPADALAQEPTRAATEEQTLEEMTREVASQLRCVVCQGLSIQDSPSELAQQMKAVVREQLAAGRTPEEVKEYFVAKYGEWVLLRPEPEGFNLAVYVLPFVALLGGAGIVFVAVRRWTRQGGEEAAEEPQTTGTA